MRIKPIAGSSSSHDESTVKMQLYDEMSDLSAKKLYAQPIADKSYIGVDLSRKPSMAVLNYINKQGKAVMQVILSDRQEEDGERARLGSERVNPCGCGAQPLIQQIREKYYKYAVYCPVPILKCQDWPAHLGATREEAITKWNDAHPIVMNDMEGNDNAPG